MLERLAINGKTLRGSGRTDGQALQVLSAVSHRLRLTLAQEPIVQKSNEIPAIKPLLQKLPRGALVGSVLTADALHCQQETARVVTQEHGADYVFGLKGNQSGIMERAQQRLPAEFSPSAYDSGWQKEHGRLQRTQLQRVAVTPEEAGLCGCAQFVAVQRERQYLRRGQVGDTNHDLSYYVTSLTAAETEAATLTSLIRGH